MSLLGFALTFVVGYFAGSRRVLRWLVPQNALARALEAEQKANEERLARDFVARMKETAAPPPPPAK